MKAPENLIQLRSWLSLDQSLLLLKFYWVETWIWVTNRNQPWQRNQLKSLKIDVIFLPCRIAISMHYYAAWRPENHPGAFPSSIYNATNIVPCLDTISRHIPTIRTVKTLNRRLPGSFLSFCSGQCNCCQEDGNVLASCYAYQTIHVTFAPVRQWPHLRHGQP